MTQDIKKQAQAIKMAVECCRAVEEIGHHPDTAIPIWPADALGPDGKTVISFKEYPQLTVGAFSALVDYYMHGGDSAGDADGSASVAFEDGRQEAEKEAGLRIADLEKALRKAAKTFRHYEELHRAKPDHVKADANAELAAEIESVLRGE